MSTQRPNEDQIISSGVQNNTVRHNEGIISSVITKSPQIISSSLSNGIILNEKKYKIDKQIARSGEAEIFLVSHDGSNYIFKYYYSQYKPKDEILIKLKGLENPDIIKLIDFGYYQDRFYEISEYAQGGTLQEIMPVTTLSKVKEIVAETIEALTYCHSHGIIHRDIKPENIFYRTSDKKDIAIGDFGIASNVKEGEELVRTSLARTSLYAAPELFTNIQGKTTIEKSVDYYALGMTILHLWFGRNPFEDIDEFGIMRLKSEGRVLFPDDIDSEVEKLIKGLITVNPRDRWAYDEVKRWLKGENVKVNYQTVQFEYKPYSFGLINGEQIVVNNPKDLSHYLDKYPEKGEGHLYRNTIAKWIEPVDAGLFNELMDIVENDYAIDRVAGLTKAIYILDPDRPFKAFNGIKLSTQEDIALHFEQHFEYYVNDLQNPSAAFYVFLEAKNYKDKANEYRGFFEKTNAEAALNTLIFVLQGTDKYIIDNYTIYQPEELLQVDDVTKAKVIVLLSNINSKLSLWIAGFERLQPSIEKWRLLKRYDETTIRYALQKGFEFNSKVAKNYSEFYSLFKTNYSSFSSNLDLINESNYWLVNYVDFSFYHLVIDYLKSETCSDKEYYEMFFYALTFSKDEEIGIYQVVQILLPEIKSKTHDNNQLFNDTIKTLELNIEGLWIAESKTKSVSFLDCLINYLSFSEKNISLFPIFFGQLTYQLNNRISTGILQDIDRIKDNENLIKSYRSKLQKIVERLEKINTDLPVVKQFHRKKALIEKSNQEIILKNTVEKQEKSTVLKDKYSEIIEEKKKYVKAKFLVSWDNSAYDFIPVYAMIIIGVISIILKIKSINATMHGGDKILEFIVGVPIIGLIFGAIGWGVGWVIKTIVNTYAESKAYNAQLKIALGSVRLSSEEQSAYDQSENEIERFFEDKKSYEIFQETVRILSLAEPNELNDSNNPNLFNKNNENIFSQEELVNSDLQISNERLGIDDKNKYNIEISDQINFDRGYNSMGSLPFDGIGKIKLENAYILFYEEEILVYEYISPFINEVTEQGKSLLIIAQGLGDKVIDTLLKNRKNGYSNIVGVSAPGFGDRRNEILEDFAIWSGGTVIKTGFRIDQLKANQNYFGKVEEVIIDPISTILIKGKGKKADVMERINLIDKQITNELSDYAKERLIERLESLTKNNRNSNNL